MKPLLALLFLHRLVLLDAMKGQPDDPNDDWLARPTFEALIQRRDLICGGGWNRFRPVVTVSGAGGIEAPGGEGWVLAGHACTS